MRARLLGNSQLWRHERSFDPDLPNACSIPSARTVVRCDRRHRTGVRDGRHRTDVRHEPTERAFVEQALGVQAFDEQAFDRLLAAAGRRRNACVRVCVAYVRVWEPSRVESSRRPCSTSTCPVPATDREASATRSSGSTGCVPGRGGRRSAVSMPPTSPPVLEPGRAERPDASARPGDAASAPRGPTRATTSSARPPRSSPWTSTSIEMHRSRYWCPCRSNPDHRVARPEPGVINPIRFLPPKKKEKKKKETIESPWNCFHQWAPPPPLRFMCVPWGIDFMLTIRYSLHDTPSRLWTVWMHPHPPVRSLRVWEAYLLEIDTYFH
jgi:hypothetical protein